MIERLRTMAGNIFANKQFLLIIIMVIGLIAATVFVYKRYVSPKVAGIYAANKEFIKDTGASDGDDFVELYLFTVDWCPHCKKAAPQWNELKEKIGTGNVNGHKIIFIEVDCEKEKDLAAQWEVKGYPTIKAKTSSGRVIDYDAKPEVSTLMKFLDSITGPQ